MNKKITKIEIQKNNKDRVNIYLNDDYAFACSADLVYKHNIKKGKVICEAEFEELIEEDNYIKAKNAALKFLEKSFKTENEIFNKLTSKEYNEKICMRVINFLKEYEFVNDEKYTEMYINDKLSNWGRNKIKYMLINKGINESMIKEALSNIEKNKEEKCALTLAQKKYKSLINSEVDYNKIYKKLGDFLARKGYDFEIINIVLKKVVNSNDFENKKKSCDENQNNNDEIKFAALKRYKILSKSENDNVKLYRKLGQYLLRKGYPWENIKKVLKEIIDGEDNF